MVAGDSRPSSRIRAVAPSSAELESGESWEEGSEGGSTSTSRAATSRKACPFSRFGQRRDGTAGSTVGERRVCIGGGQSTRETVGFGILKAAKSKLEAPIGERLDSCQRFLERARKRVTSAESAIADAVAERDRLVAELAEGEKRMERLREEARAAPPPRDVVGDEFLDDVAQMRQEILELRRFRDRHPASALRGAEGPLVLENITAMPENPHQLETWIRQERRSPECSGVEVRSSHPQSACGHDVQSSRQIVSIGGARIARSGSEERSFRTLLRSVQGRNSLYGYRGVRVGPMRPHRSPSRVEPTIYRRRR